MTTVLVSEGPGFAVRRARTVDRALAGLRARRLDGELIAGAAPESRMALSLRAQRLIGMRERRGLAAALRNVARSAANPGPLNTTAGPLPRSTALACSAELHELADVLAAPGPVSPRGVALVRRILSDGAGRSTGAPGRTGRTRWRGGCPLPIRR